MRTTIGDSETLFSQCRNCPFTAMSDERLHESGQGPNRYMHRSRKQQPSPVQIAKTSKREGGQPSSQGPKRNQQFPHSSFGFMQFVQDSLAEPMTCKNAQQKDPRYEKKHTDRTFQHSRCQNRYKDCSSV